LPRDSDLACARLLAAARRSSSMVSVVRMMPGYQRIAVMSRCGRIMMRVRSPGWPDFMISPVGRIGQDAAP
jgi:hypothetical protein